MSKKIILCLVLCVFICVAFVSFAQDRGAGQRGERGAQTASKPDNPQSLAHIDAAKKMAGNDTFLQSPYNFFCIPANTRANNANAPELEPIKLFDNVYAVGNSETVVYVITAPEGLLMFDSGYADRVETVVVPGLQKLGLDPAKVKYILLGHGHGDHFGGSKYFQDHYGTKVGTTAADWDLMYPANPPANQNPNANQGRPKKDLVLAEGQPIKFGGLSITPFAIPGHTPGSLAFIFPVKDKGKTLVEGLFHGRIVSFEINKTERVRVNRQ